MLLVVRDRTDELRRDQAEREFVSNAAHELRNPIAGMSGAIEVLRSGAKDDPEAREHFLDRLAVDVDRVSRLTRALLTLARMEAIGEGEADVVSVDLAIQEAVLALDAARRRRAADRDRARSRRRRGPGPAAPGADRPADQRLQAHPRSRRRYASRADSEEDSQVVIEVEDTGTGIRPEEQDRVFERFYRGSGSLEREGFGLGLAIAKRMVDVMGGELSVASEEGRGSTFTIRLRSRSPDRDARSVSSGAHPRRRRRAVGARVGRLRARPGGLRGDDRHRRRRRRREARRRRGRTSTCSSSTS